MSEKRRPDVVFNLKSGEVNRRYEVFYAEQFMERSAKVPFFHADQLELQISPADLENQRFVRVRLDGVWQPQGRRAFYPAHRLATLIAQDVSRELRKEV